MMDRFRHWLNNLAPSLRGDDRRAPPVLSLRRKRDLTLPLPADQSETQQITLPQEQSNFFAKLPIDIRLMIYRHVFGNRSIHVAYEYCESSKKWEVWSIECFTPDFLGQGDCCRERWGRLRKLSPRPYKVSDRLAWAEIEISLLLSCRQVYSEGIDLLYSTNEFRFDDTLTLRLFPALILPQRLAQITTLVFNWPLSYLDQPHVSIYQQNRYDAVWELLASGYPGLRKLRVSLMAPGRSARGNATVEQFKRAWLEPLDRLASLKLETFRVFTPKTFYFYFKEMPSETPYCFVETAHIEFPVGAFGIRGV